MTEQAELLPLALVAVGGYLLGSVPFGVVVMRAAGAGDPRAIGSGNIGATNVLPSGRRGLALLPLLGDGCEGAQALAWYHADIADNDLYGGDLPRALGAIRARVLLLPSATDLYFRVADNEAESRHLASAELCPIPTVWGHRAGNPNASAEDEAFLSTAVRRWLQS